MLALAAEIRLQLFFEELKRRLGHDQDGQDMVEYALLVGLITLGTIAIIILVGPTLKNLFQDIVNNLGMA